MKVWRLEKLHDEKSMMHMRPIGHRLQKAQCYISLKNDEIPLVKNSIAPSPVMSMSPYLL
eukprot:140815-Ditylum_brightwellii.AAC.1